MQPKKLRPLVDEAIEHRLKTGSNALFTPYLIRNMERAWRRHARKEEDYRRGFDSYGYQSPEDNEGHLSYISDRWRCAFRLRWLLDGLANGHI